MTVHTISKGLLQQDATMTSVADKQPAATSAIEAAFSAALQRATLNFGGSAGMPSANTALKERFERQPAQARDDAPKAERPDARRGDKPAVKPAQGPARAERPKAAAEQKVDRPAAVDAAPDRADANTDPVDAAAPDRADDDAQPVQQADGNQTAADPQATQPPPTEAAATVAAAMQATTPNLAQILPVEQTVAPEAMAVDHGAQADPSGDDDAGAARQDPFAWLDTSHGNEIASLQNKIDAGDAADAADQADFAASLAAAAVKADPAKGDTGADIRADASALAQQQADLLAEQLAGTTQQVSVTVKVNQAAADAPVQTAGAVLEALGLLDPAVQADANAAGQDFTPQNGQGSDGSQGTATAAAQVAANGALENVQTAGNAAAARPFAAALAAQLEASEPKAASTAGQTEAQPVGGLTGTNAAQAAQKATPAQAAQPASRPLPVPPQHIIDQINVQIDKQLKDGHDTIKISLKPVELGKIEIKLEVGADGRVTAQVTADRPETLAILQKDSKGLEKALSDAGLKAEETSLSFNLRGEQQQNANTGAEGRRAGRGRGRAAEDVGEVRGNGFDTAAAQPHRLSGRSGVDITV